MCTYAWNQTMHKLWYLIIKCQINAYRSIQQLLNGAFGSNSEPPYKQQHSSAYLSAIMCCWSALMSVVFCCCTRCKLLIMLLPQKTGQQTEQKAIKTLMHVISAQHLLEWCVTSINKRHRIHKEALNAAKMIDKEKVWILTLLLEGFDILPTKLKIKSKIWLSNSCVHTTKDVDSCLTATQH